MVKLSCTLCGRVFIFEDLATDSYDNDEEDITLRRSIVFCQLCEARIKKESDQSQKIPKPI